MRRGQGAKPFFRFDPFFKIQFKNTSNLILLGFKMSSERFSFKNFETGLTFWHMWFFNFQNLVRRCFHIDGTPCICTWIRVWKWLLCKMTWSNLRSSLSIVHNFFLFSICTLCNPWFLNLHYSWMQSMPKFQSSWKWFLAYKI